MSTTAPVAPLPGTIQCPRCAATLGPDQDWCLECGAPARTRLAPTPAWRIPMALVAAIIVLALIALGAAFVALTGDDQTVTAPASTVAPVPVAPPAPAPPPAVRP